MRGDLPALNAHKVELLDNPRLASQLCGLERRVIRGTGRESIDHGPGRHDDVANAVCGALLEASTAAAAWEISEDVLHRARLMVPRRPQWQAPRRSFRGLGVFG